MNEWLSEHSTMSTRPRLVVSAVAGSMALVLSYIELRMRGHLGSDFNWMWAAARYFWHGHNPYYNPAFGTGHPYPFHNPLPYPLPAVFFSMPFAPFPPYFAAALFFGVSVAILAFGASRHGWLYLPMFLSAPLVVAATVAQWSPLVVAGAFLPAFLPILVIKPNLAVAINGRKPLFSSIPMTVLTVVISFIVLPTWVHDWLNTLSQHYNPIPLFVLPFGPILLLSLVAWRRPAGRLLILMMLIPQTPYFYDQLPLWLIPETKRQGAYLSIFSWISLCGWWLVHGHDSMGASVYAAQPWIVTLIYLPAMTVVLWQEYLIRKAAKATDPSRDLQTASRSERSSRQPANGVPETS